MSLTRRHPKRQPRISVAGKQHRAANRTLVGIEEVKAEVPQPAAQNHRLTGGKGSFSISASPVA